MSLCDELPRIRRNDTDALNIESKQECRARLEKEVEEYLAKGGTIKKCLMIENRDDNLVIGNKGFNGKVKS